MFINSQHLFYKIIFNDIVRHCVPMLRNTGVDIVRHCMPIAKGTAKPCERRNMCLYEQSIKNPKYLPNEKNKGRAPACTDDRLSTIKIGCGWCSECRKKIASEWRIRLYEDIKTNKDCNFVTLSYSPEALKQLEIDMYKKKWRGLETNDGAMETDVNMLAAYSVRMWTERWRKHIKKAPRHWLVTELGHKNSERIHLHGFIWYNKNEIKEILEKTWKYGNIYIGDYVNNRTINYVIKYVTKIDQFHKGYKQAIITSKGIGKSYIERNKERHKYNKEKTITKYKTYDGKEIALPRYYKEKIWNEKEREEIWKIQLEKNEIIIDGEKINKSKITTEELNEKLKNARENNKRAGYGDYNDKNTKYIITELMTKNKNEIINYNKEKLIQKITKRYIENIKEHESNEIDKTNGVKIIYYGRYKGVTTEAQRNYNELLTEAQEKKIPIRILRLIKKGIIVDNFVDK